jgi:hypothetical protein
LCFVLRIADWSHCTAADLLPALADILLAYILAAELTESLYQPSITDGPIRVRKYCHFRFESVDTHRGEK